MCASDAPWPALALLVFVGCQQPMTDFVPRHPGYRSAAPTPNASVEIVLEGPPRCDHQVIGSTFAAGPTKKVGHCVGLLRDRAAKEGGSGVFDVTTTKLELTSMCMARVYVCTGAQ